ncbi:MAG TPA: molybdate ABC transporter permease subunit [Vicinamibacterales bacterium]|nr:molybdate ABC transporter permease subunit [Vicinamibacterales bacterium]
MPENAIELAGFSALMALLATVVALPPGVALGWLLARRAFPGRSVVETLATLPLVMPPVATGLILLRLFGRRSPVGRALESAGLDIVFTWKAVVIAMAVMSLPLIVLTAKAGFEHLNPRFEQMAGSLGAGPLRVFFTVSLPLAGRSVIAAALLGFARALGEFGATIMVAGGIPGQTETLSVAIYRFTEIGRDDEAMGLLMLSVALAFIAMFASHHVLRRRTA